jgi:hypothetical protein
MQTRSASSVLNDASIVSTLVDAARALTRGERWSAAFLVVAAVLSNRIPGLGVAASVVVRLARRFR